MKIINLFIFFSFVAFAILIFEKFLNGNTHLETIYYDFYHSNPTVNSKSELNQVLKEFEIISYSDLPKEYLEETKMKSTKYSSMVRSMKFFRIKKEDCYRKVVGDFRIKDFIARDDYYWQTSYRSSDDLYWGTKTDILEKLMDLKYLLEKREYNWNAIRVNSGHRTPKKNEAVGGASKSRHIVGEAVDLKIGDIDNSGFYTEKDKAIVLKIIEEEIIGNKGGVGKYPGTRVIHMDTRGYRARWNDY